MTRAPPSIFAMCKVGSGWGMCCRSYCFQRGTRIRRGSLRLVRSRHSDRAEYTVATPLSQRNDKRKAVRKRRGHPRRTLCIPSAYRHVEFLALLVQALANALCVLVVHERFAL